MAPVSAHDVAAELRRRVPGVGTVKLHKLLYYCQGHHLAEVGEPLFWETVSAWDMGPVVGTLWRAEKHGTPPRLSPITDEGQLNTIGYVASRYGGLTGADLKHLTHAETPWVRANARRPAGDSVKIEPEWMAEYFRDEIEDPDDPAAAHPRTDAMAALVRAAVARRHEPARPDTPEALAAVLGL